MPQNRGFDSFYGFWEGGEDYYEKTIPGRPGPGAPIYYDFHFNENLVPKNESQYYSTVRKHKTFESKDDIYSLRQLLRFDHELCSPCSERLTSPFLSQLT